MRVFSLVSCEHSIVNLNQFPVQSLNLTQRLSGILWQQGFASEALFNLLIQE